MFNATTAQTPLRWSFGDPLAASSVASRTNVLNSYAPETSSHIVLEFYVILVRL